MFRIILDDGYIVLNELLAVISNGHMAYSEYSVRHICSFTWKGKI